jgi:hypothetical protein
MLRLLMVVLHVCATLMRQQARPLPRNEVIAQSSPLPFPFRKAVEHHELISSCDLFEVTVLYLFK